MSDELANIIRELIDNHHKRVELFTVTTIGAVLSFEEGFKEESKTILNHLKEVQDREKGLTYERLSKELLTYVNSMMQQHSIHLNVVDLSEPMHEFSIDAIITIDDVPKYIAYAKESNWDCAPIPKEEQESLKQQLAELKEGDK